MIQICSYNYIMTQILFMIPYIFLNSKYGYNVRFTHRSGGGPIWDLRSCFIQLLKKGLLFCNLNGYFMFWLKVQVPYVYKHSLHGYNLNIYKMQNLHPSLFEMSSIVISETKMHIHVFHFLSSLPLSKHGLM